MQDLRSVCLEEQFPLPQGQALPGDGKEEGLSSFWEASCREAPSPCHGPTQPQLPMPGRCHPRGGSAPLGQSQEPRLVLNKAGAGPHAETCSTLHSPSLPPRVPMSHRVGMHLRQSETQCCSGRAWGSGGQGEPVSLQLIPKLRHCREQTVTCSSEILKT